MCIFVSLHVQITQPLAAKLQGKEQDVHCAITSVNDCVAVMQQIRDDVTFEQLFEAATAVYGDAIPMPRLTTRQRNRVNVPASSAQEYYRRAMFLPFLDCCVEQLKQRFSK